MCKVDKVFENLRIDELLWQVREDLIKHHPDYSIEISLNENLDDNSLTVSGDEQLLKVALSNIIENGCKYSESHTVNIELNQRSKFLELIFTDNGIGIAEEDLKIIMEPFQRGKNALGAKGHGIGLSLVDAIIKMHNANISITSALNKGTEIRVNIPFLG